MDRPDRVEGKVDSLGERTENGQMVKTLILFGPWTFNCMTIKFRFLGGSISRHPYFVPSTFRSPKVVTSPSKFPEIEL